MNNTSSIIKARKRKINDDILHDLSMELVGSNVKYLSFPSFCASERLFFSYDKSANAIVNLLFLESVKEMLKFLCSLAMYLCFEKKLHSSVDAHLLPLIKSKINYLPLEGLKEGLPAGLIDSDCVKACRVIPLVFQQFYFLTSNA